MREFFYKKWVKACMAVLCIISFNVMAASFSLMTICESENVYSKTEEEIREQMQEKVCMNYSIMAVARYKSDFCMDKLSGTNFRYGVIQADKIEGMDLNNKRIYKACNFDRKVTEDMLHIHAFDVGESTEFRVGSSLFDSFYLYNDLDVIYTEDGNEILSKTDSTKRYYVLSYVKKPLKEQGEFFSENLFGKLKQWERQDYFVQAEAVVSALCAVKGWVFELFLLSLALFLFSLVGLFTGAGHRGAKEVVPGWADRIPFDVFTAAALILGTVFPAIIAAENISHVHGSVQWMVQIGLLCFCAEEILILVFAMSAASRIKMGTWWKNTLCVRTYTFIKKWIKNKIRNILELYSRMLPMMWRAWAVMAGLAVLELMGLTAAIYRPGMQVSLWLMEKIALYALITKFLLQMKKLQHAGAAIAAGELEEKISTDGMFWDLKEHGENLNNIRNGINHAVEERLKSERFKTELITNVSHDIKTPLTSIINYVDLLEKEELDNPNAREYLNVLGRQSQRLKKLIEDLMEASKASTGNLAVVCESCDAHVMLTQTIGEYEEKLKASQIELIVKESEEQILLWADPRHLWRIFDNLMNNICKYAQASTRAYVNIEKQEEAGKIVFRNISKYALNIESEELLDRFVRGDGSRNTEGSGLGLSIANSLTELMGGTFELVTDGDLFKVIVTFQTVKDHRER